MLFNKQTLVYSYSRSNFLSFSRTIYKKSIEKIINAAKTTKSNGKPIGYWVRKLKMDDRLRDAFELNQIEALELMIELCYACPYVFFIGYNKIVPIPFFNYYNVQSNNNTDENKNTLCKDLIFLHLDVVSEFKSEN
ncbi:unnamed protein product [Cunninghamella echinulata]